MARTRKKPEPRERRKWIEIPVPPTREMLIGMACATFKRDGSLLEMERRFSGMIARLPTRQRRSR